MNAGVRRLDIQGLRGVAVLLVVLYHADLLFKGGFLGVDAFFVISGFVITSSLVRERVATGTLSFRGFYARRARRLLPAFAVATSVTLVVAAPFGSHKAASITANTAGAALAFNANTYLAFLRTGDYFEARAQANPLLHLWSLSVEEQFYFVFPLVLWLCWRSSTRHHRSTLALGVLASIAAASIAAQIGVAHMSSGSPRSGSMAFYLAPLRFWEFLAGTIAALCIERSQRVELRHRSALGWTGAAVLVAIALLVEGRPETVVVGPVLAVGSTVALIVAGSLRSPGSRTPVIERLLSGRVLTRLGDISYSWYLWHWPLIVLAHATFPTVGAARGAAAALSLAPAWASARLLENRYRTRTNTSRHGLAVLVAISLAAPAMAAVALRQVAPTLANLSSAKPFGHHLDQRKGCSSTTPVDQRPPGRCVFMGDVQSPELLLVGDSNAGQFSEAAEFAARKLGMRLRLATAGGCPFTTLRVRRGGREDLNCSRFVESALEWIDKTNPKVVVISTASDLWLSDERIAFAAADSEFTTDPAAKSSLYAKALAEVLSRFGKAGAQVVLIHPVPKLSPEWDPIEWSLVALASGPDWLNTGISRPDALERRTAAVEAERQAASEAGVTVFDPFDLLCPAEACTAYADGTWSYRDGLHISVAAAEGLSPALTEAIRRTESQ